MRWMLWGAAALVVAYGCQGSDPDLGPTEPGTDGGNGNDANVTAAPPDCSAIYVKAGASDGTGCQDKPFGTINAALARARTNPAEIRVCAGTYAESALTLDVAVSIIGSLDCATWKPDPGYMYPTLMSASPTIVTNANFLADNTTLSVKGSAIGRSVVLRGLQIQGGPPNPSGPVDGTGMAMSIEDGASPTIDSCRVLGGAMTRSSVQGSVGIHVGGGSAAEIMHSIVDGGSGIITTNRGGSVGIAVSGLAKPYIHDNKINGGSGTGDGAYIASTGLSFHLDQGMPGPGLTAKDGATVERNEINGGSGKATGGAGTNGSIGSCALHQEYGAIDATDNLIDAGTGVSPASSTLPSAVAIYVFQNFGQPAHYDRNRIIGGHKEPFGSPTPTRTTAVRIFDSGQVFVTNSLVVGGTGDSGGNAFEIHNGGVAPRPDELLSVRNSTIVAGATFGMTFYAHVDIENDVFVTRAAESLFTFPSCPPIADTAFRGNAFLGSAKILDASGVSCTGATTIADFETAMSAPAATRVHVASHNVRYESDCGAETFSSGTGCITNAACTTGIACATALLDGFDAAAIATTGWSPKATGSCALATGGDDLTVPMVWPFAPDAGADAGYALPVIDKDFLSAMRTPPLSRGALEQNTGGCTNP